MIHQVCPFLSAGIPSTACVIQMVNELLIPWPHSNWWMLSSHGFPGEGIESIAKEMNSTAKVTNLIANGMRSIAKVTNSITKTYKSS